MKDTKIPKTLLKTNEESFRSQVKELFIWCKENYYHLKNNADYVYCEPMSEEEKGEIQDRKIVALIREKYSETKEFKVQRKRDIEPEKFQEYYDYVEECIATIKG